MNDSRIARAVQATGRCCSALGAITMIALALLVVVGVGMRLSGLAMPGRSELSQLFIVVVASTSLVVATVVDGHARVHLVVDRLSDAARRWLAVLTAALGVVYWGVVAWANAQVFIDNTRLIERTELLHVPVSPFRGLWVASLMLVCVVLLARLLWPRQLAPGHA